MKNVLRMVIACALVFALLAPAACAANDLIMATGGTGGTYYPLGGEISALLASKIPDLTIIAQVSNASDHNLELIAQGEAELALVQNDVAVNAYTGAAKYEGKPNTSFMVIGALYPEVVQIVAAPDSGIATIADLKGKKVSVGAAASGTMYNAESVLASAGITLDDIQPQYLSFAESAAAFQDKQLDAFFVTSGVPNVSIMDVSAQRAVNLVSITPEEVTQLVDTYAYYTPYIVSAGTYSGQLNDASTINMMAILVVKADLDEALVYEITKALYENINDIQHSKKEEISLVTAGEGFPHDMLHPGALKYLLEVGAVILGN